MDPLVDAIRSIPPGRMAAVRQLEVSLRGGATFVQAATRAKISLSTAKTWAARFAFRKCDMDRETPQARLARYLALALALQAEGRIDEAGLYEAEARKLETVLARLDRRRDADTELPVQDPYVPARAFLDHIARTLGEGAGRSEAWTALAVYYRELRELGAVISPDGRVVWSEGEQPPEVPPCPDWLPCEPWDIRDDALWDAAAGAAIRLF